MRRSEEKITPYLLVVEDDTELADLINLIMQFLGAIPVHLAHCAQDAVAAVEGVRPVVVFLDFAVPGSERLILTLRADPRTARIPIVALVIRTEISSVELRQLGADECLRDLDLQQIEAVLVKYHAGEKA